MEARAQIFSFVALLTLTFHLLGVFIFVWGETEPLEPVVASGTEGYAVMFGVVLFK